MFPMSGSWRRERQDRRQRKSYGHDLSGSRNWNQAGYHPGFRNTQFLLKFRTELETSSRFQRERGSETQILDAMPVPSTQSDHWLEEGCACMAWSVVASWRRWGWRQVQENQSWANCLIAYGPCPWVHPLMMFQSSSTELASYLSLVDVRMVHETHCFHPFGSPAFWME